MESLNKDHTHDLQYKGCEEDVEDMEVEEEGERKGGGENGDGERLEEGEGEGTVSEGSSQEIDTTGEDTAIEVGGEGEKENKEQKKE